MIKISNQCWKVLLGFFLVFFFCYCFYRDDSWSPAPLVCSTKTLLWNHHCLKRINVLGFRELVLPTKIHPHEPLTKYRIASPPPNESDSIENMAVFQIKPQTTWHYKDLPTLLKEPNKGPIFCSFHQLWWRHINATFLSVPFRQPNITTNRRVTCILNTYQLDHIKKDFFKRLLFLRISNSVCVFPTVCSLDFVRLFNFSMHTFGTGRPFILAICLITFSASRILLFDTSHRKLSGRMLRVNEMKLMRKQSQGKHISN